ncbi:MAG: hypothetical protein EA419_04650 [Wenzhouxiangella sp.]|nr:MAG: hypothetical protein EA419_04650 [Wenzhouxiangella sp.]
MAGNLGAEDRERSLETMAAVLDDIALRGCTITYLELADAIAMPGPQRIHRTTRLLEILMKRDAEAGRPLRSALAVSRVGGGLPAAGFFDRARRLGLFDGREPSRFHSELLRQLYCSE